MGDIETQVLIVGAGPVGLTLALSLADHRVPFRIIDPLEAPSTRCKAHGLQGRTVEMLAMLGVADDLVGAMQRPPPQLEFWYDRRVVHLPAAPEHGEPYPGAVPVMQQIVERILADALAARGHEVDRGCQLSDFESDDDGVTAKVERADGTLESVRAAWLIGCDGVHSTTRKRLGLAMEGYTGDEVIWITEGNLSWDRPHTTWYNWDNAAGHVSAIWVECASKWHIIVVPRGQTDEAPSLDRLNEVFRAATGLSDTITDADEIGVLRINQRMPDRFVVGRAILAGDAAHAHNPAAGQGMNTGIQDVMNLAWKLALAVHGAATPDLVQSYEDERLPNARQLLKDTASYSKIMTPPTKFRRFLTWLLFSGIAKVPAIQKAQLHRVGMFNQNQRTSRLTSASQSGRTGRGGRKDLAAGDYLPHAPCSIAGAAGVLRDVFHPQAALLLVAGADPEPSTFTAFDALDAVVNPIAEHVRVVRVVADAAHLPAGIDPSSPDVVVDVDGAIIERCRIRGAEVLYVRPDGYIGLRTDDLSAASLRAYLGRIYAGELLDPSRA